MAQENTVSFKVFLHTGDPNDKPEVRRFGIDRDVVSNFNYLSEKLQSVFPTLNNKRFDVSWKDGDGDDVLISTDDELMIALTEMPGDVRKLFVAIKGDRAKENFARRPKINHPGVVCDECENGVVGFRYKCLECNNFDLCLDCESKELHHEHFMIRLPVPVIWRPHFGKRLAHHLSKWSRRCPASCPADDATGTCGDGEACNCTCGHGRGHGGRRQGHYRGGQAMGLMEALSTLAGGLFNGADPLGRRSGENAKEAEGTAANGQAETPKASTSKTQGEDSGAGKTAPPPPPEDEKMQYLQDVGRAVASFLDPFGIDVDVIVEKNKPAHKPEETQQSEEKTKKNVSFADEIAKKVKEEIGDVSKKEPSNSESGSERESPEKDDWTVVSEAEASNQESSAASGSNVPKETLSSAPKSEADAGSSSAAANANASTGAVPKNPGGFPVFYPPPPSFTNIPSPFPINPPVAPQMHWPTPPAPFPIQVYPRLPLHPSNLVPQVPMVPRPHPHPEQQQQPQQQPQPPQPAFMHPNPKINQTIESMMSMGFSNEGGWLTQLVEMKNGDIEKVLDLLQPVKKN